MSIQAEIDGSDVGPLGRLALSRSAVDRATQRRSDAEWIEAAWADPRTRVVVVHASQALGRTVNGGPELVFASAADAPAGTRFFLGVNDDGVAYFGVSASAEAEPWAWSSRGGCRAPLPAGGGGVAERSRYRPADPRHRACELARHARALPEVRRRDRAGPGRPPDRVAGGWHRALPEARPGGDHAGHRSRRPVPAGAERTVAEGPDVGSGRVRRAGGVGRARGRARGLRGDRDRRRAGPLPGQPAVADAAQPDARIPGDGGEQASRSRSTRKRSARRAGSPGRRCGRRSTPASSASRRRPRSPDGSSSTGTGRSFPTARRAGRRRPGNFVHTYFTVL